LASEFFLARAMPKVLSEIDVADFRERLCAVAERLFAEHGPEAVTIRQLAAELGVSPMTPYRYFTDKDDILATVRANGFNRFSEVLETARAAPGSAQAKSAAAGQAYVRFAREHPHTYKLMFDLDQPNAAQYPGLVAAALRARTMMSAHVKDMVAAGDLVGDPEQIGVMFWAAIHGVVVLEMAGHLPAERVRGLIGALSGALVRGLQPT
jgi:AcrR family transcriptional regulator